ncbi:MAG: DNA repair protein RecO [Tissierellia bacterium]|nr:DNA repair protein RecO [Tissierellia bacterium]MDD4781390.1 DNA repair protein RecO [Tissierellia bacterium]
MIIEEEVLILKEVNYKENDKILHALSKTKGKIQLLSRGCKKNNSPLINVSQLFAYSRCSLYKTKDMFIINSAELIDNFYNIRNNMNALLYGSYILELIGYVASENDVGINIFNMTISIIRYFSQFNKDFDKITTAYELKLVSMLGFKPDFSNCLSCGEKLNPSINYLKFIINEGGFYCPDCVKYGNGINLTYNEILTINRILKSKFDDISSIDNINDKILNAIRQFLFYHIGKSNFTTLKLL